MSIHKLERYQCKAGLEHTCHIISLYMSVVHRHNIHYSNGDQAMSYCPAHSHSRVVKNKEATSGSGLNAPLLH